MKKYKVEWGWGYLEGTGHPAFRIKADSPEEAYAKFLESEQKLLNMPVVVTWGVFGLARFEEHVKKLEKEEHVKKTKKVPNLDVRKAEARIGKTSKSEDKYNRKSDREKQDQLLRMMADEQKGAARKTASSHVPKTENIRKPSDPSSVQQSRAPGVNFEPVERRSGWAFLQVFCGVICLIAGFAFLSEEELVTAIVFIGIGIQAFFIGFLINVFTDIRWFLQESLKIQQKRKR